jgi:hypothetical protein
MTKLAQSLLLAAVFAFASPAFAKKKSADADAKPADAKAADAKPKKEPTAKQKANQEKFAACSKSGKGLKKPEFQKHMKECMGKK